jgi:hypothetical protein
MDLVSLANYKPGYIRKRGIQVEIPRGGVGWSEVELAKRWKWSRGKVRRYLGELKTAQQIEQQTTNVTSWIYIVNYELYQGDGTAEQTADSTTNGTADGQQTEQQTVPEEEVQEVKKDKKGKKTPKPRRAAEPAPPLIEALRLGMGRYPAKHTWAAIQEQVNGKELDLAMVTQHAAEWVANGWNRTNYIGALRYHMEKAGGAGKRGDHVPGELTDWEKTMEE